MESDISVRVAGVRTREVAVPFRRPLATRAGLFETAPFLLVDLWTEGGQIGRVPVFGFHSAGPALIGASVRAMAAPLIGRTVRACNLPAIADELTSAFLLLGTQGLARFAQSVLDLALHDALARASDVPLWHFLDGSQVPIAAYNSNGLGLVSPEVAAREAVALVEEGGYRHVKCRGGRTDPLTDRAVVVAVRDAVGADVTLSIDFNQSLPPDTAQTHLAALDDLDLAWFEEPVRAEDDIAAAALRPFLRTPIMMGECYYGAEGAIRAHRAGAFDLLMPDAMRIGGATGGRRTAEQSARHNIPMSSHMAPEYSVHLLSATPTADWLEFVDWGAELIRDPLRVRDGTAVAPDRIGSGIEWNDAVVADAFVAERTIP